MSDWLVVVAADGAGSASHSEIGATVACDEFVRRIEAIDPTLLFDVESMTSLFTDVRHAIFAQAERFDVSPREVACTALLAVVGPASAAFAQIGDGAMVIGEGQDRRAVFWPEPAEYANTTDFLTDVQFADLLKFEKVTGEIVEVAAFTDGLQRLALDFAARTPFSNFFSPLFNELRSAVDTESLMEPFRNFLDSERMNARTDDDKTLVLAVQRL